MGYRNEVYFPYVDTSAADEARKASREASENRERLAQIEGEQQRHFANQGDEIRSIRNSVGTMSRVISDLEHRIEVLFKKDEKQTINVQNLQGQTSELASVVVDLSKKLETSQEVQKEVVECLIQMREALVAIAEHVASLEAGSRDVMGLVEGILMEGIEGLQEGKEGDEGTVGLPHTTREFMASVDVLCREFRFYDEEAVETFDFSKTPPQVRPEMMENLERSQIREERQHFAEAFHGKITEAMFRKFLCENLAGKGFPEINRIFYHEKTKNLFNPTVEMICDAMIEQDNNIEQHPGG